MLSKPRFKMTALEEIGSMLRRLIPAMLLSFLFFFALAGTALRTSPAEAGQVAVVTGSVVNLRGGAGTSHPVVGEVRQGERMSVLGKSGDWVQVRTAGGVTAWVAGWLVRVENMAAPQPQPEPQPQPQPEQQPKPQPQPPGSSSPPETSKPPTDQPLNGNAVVRVDAVDVRSQPGNHYTAIAQATRGFKLPLVAQRGSWYQIMLPSGTLGWVESSTVDLEPETPSRGDGVRDGLPGTYEVEVQGNAVVITAYSQEPMTHNVFRLPGPDRIVIDIDGFPAEQLPERILSSSVVDRIRTGVTDGRFRLVCDLKQGLSRTRYRTSLSGDQRILTVEIFTAEDGQEGRVIVLDPGHGGSDPGAIGPTGLKEKDVTLPIALEAARLLREEGAEVILTRSSDQFVELDRRAELANQAGADIFVSIHINANPDRSKHGTSTYYWPDPDVMTPGQAAARENLARALQNALLRELGRHDLGLFQARFVVLRATHVTSALVEVAFISNPEEEALLRQRDYQNRAAAAIVEGIRDYFQRY